MDPFTAAAAISAGSSLLGGLFGRKQQDKVNAQSMALNREQFERIQTRSIQDRVADAKAAGIHPLFALGASVSSASASPFVPDTGNYLGEGIAAAGGAAANALTSRPAPGKGTQLKQDESAKAMAGLQQRLVESQIRRSDAETLVALSEAKRLEQSTLNVGRDINSLAGVGLTAYPRQVARRPPKAADRTVTADKIRQRPGDLHPRATTMPQFEAVPGYKQVLMGDGTVAQIPDIDVVGEEFLSPAYLAFKLHEIEQFLHAAKGAGAAMRGNVKPFSSHRGMSSGRPSLPAYRK